MSRHIIQIFKQLGNEKWSNRYLVEATLLSDAVNAAQTITLRERNFHATNVQFTLARVSTELPGDEIFQTVPLNTVGAMTIDGGQLPLWNVVRVDITVGSGRPSRKFYRCPIDEGRTENGIVSGTFVSAITADINALIGEVNTLDSVTLVDPDGQAWVDATVHGLLVNRKLHRRRRKLQNTGGLIT